MNSKVMAMAVLLISIGISIASAQTYLARVEMDRGWFLIDGHGKRVGDKTYGHINAFSDGMAPARKNGWGYINTSGEMVIESKFIEPGPFSCGIARVSIVNGEYFYINKFGKRINPKIFSEGQVCSDSMFFAKVKDEYFFRLYSCNGQEVITGDKYKEVTPFKNGKASVRVGKNLWRVIDKNGNTLFEGSFKELGNCEEDRILFNDGVSWGYLDTTYKVVVSAKYYNANSFASGYAKVVEWDTRVLYLIDKNGKEFLLPYKSFGPFSEGMIRVKDKSGKWGYLNLKLNLVIPCNYLAVKDFKEGLALVKTETGWGYINSAGTWIVKPDLLGGKNCKNGMLLVKLYNGKWGFMDKKGVLKSDEYVHAYPFELVEVVGDGEVDEVE